jgi:hypothetical protein
LDLKIPRGVVKKNWVILDTAPKIVYNISLMQDYTQQDFITKRIIELSVQVVIQGLVMVILPNETL